MNLTKKEAKSFAAAAVAFKEWLFKWTEEVWAAIEPILELFVNHWRDAYLQAGEPYGSSDDGMWRWVREVIEAADTSEPPGPCRVPRGGDQGKRCPGG